MEDYNKGFQKKILAIINPVSGNKNQEGIDKLLLQQIDDSRFTVEIKRTEFRGHASVIAKEAIEKGVDIVLAIGGDGTVNEVAKALVGADVILGIIPCGSGNGLARHLKVPMNVTKAIKWIQTARVESMDVIKANEELFVNVAGIGFDAVISHEFEKMETRGFSSYVKASLKMFFQYPDQEYSIRSSKGEFHQQGFILSFANSSQYGNNAFIAPKASVSDGKINMVIIRKPKFYQIPALVVRMFTKTLNKSPLVSEFLDEEFEVSQPGTLGHVDGEPIEIGQQIKISVLKTKLNVFSGNVTAK